MNAADALVTATILPSVARDVGGYRYFAWATAGLLMGGIVAGSSAGALSNRLGLRRALVLSALTYTIGCAASAVAPSIFTFLAGRIVQGVGGGWIVGLVFVAIGVLFPEPLWPRLFAAISSVWGVSALLGPLVGGVFAGAGLWRWAFWGFATQGALMAAAVLLLLKREQRPESNTGIPWAQLALVLLAVALTAAAEVSAEPFTSLVLVASGLGVLALMLRIDARAFRQLLPRAAADLSSIAGSGYAMIFLLSAGAVAFSVYGAAMLQAAYGLSPLQAGYVVGAEAIGWSFVAVLVARVGRRWQDRFIGSGGGLLTLGMVGLATSLGRASLAWVVLSALCLGAGFGCCFAFVNGRIVGGLDEGERAVGSSAVPTVQMTGNAVGAAAAGALANLLGLGGGITSENTARAAPWLFGVFAPVAAAGWLASRRVARSQPRPIA